MFLFKIEKAIKILNKLDITTIKYTFDYNEIQMD